MFDTNNKFISMFLLLIILLIAIPNCFASDDLNDTSNVITSENTNNIQYTDSDDKTTSLDSQENINNDKISDSDNIKSNKVTSTNIQEIKSSNDYYFNSSLDTDGDGSIDNPYNYLNKNRFKSNSNLHLANGDYSLSNDINVNEITLIGENPEQTILKYSGTSISGKFSITNGKSFIICNMTLIGFNININSANIKATNVIFKDTTALPLYSEGNNLVNSATNSFGGVIYAYNNNNIAPNVNLNNCTFINNVAEYGGAIYIDNGDLNINNSKFINNNAYNYGGAISSKNTNANIHNSSFIKDISTNDAGGAIYLYKSQLSSSNINITDCSSTFGGAITSLHSKTNLINFNAKGNTAKYFGGAIYQVYDELTIENSIFTTNLASDGGALYIDNLTNFKLNNIHFTKNKATNYGGAIYSMLSNTFNLKNINYKDNSALINDTLYQTDKILTIITDNDFTLYYNDINYDGNLPKSYDLRELNLVTPVKDQQKGGNCWAFASIASLESAILKATGTILDLSEENMKNIMAYFSDYGLISNEPNDGGNVYMSIGYLTSWLGPIEEINDLYDDYSALSPVLDSLTHIQNIVFINPDKIKESIMKYGAIYTTMTMDQSYSYYKKSTASYYYTASESANHAVTIVGWDDTYSKNNFYQTPAGNGAWIVKNSWNTKWGDNGYFYVSYYDTKFAKNSIEIYAFVLNDSLGYTKNYQYDIIGKTENYYNNKKTIWAENIFNATDNELLSGVSTYFQDNTNWDLSIYVNNALELTQNGKSMAGYFTIPLNKKIELKKGDIFKIVFKFSNEAGASFSISNKNYAKTTTTYSSGISFYSDDGNTWYDLYNKKSSVACIKAFTTNIPTELTLNYNNNDESEVTVTAKINNGITGQITFKLNDEEYSIENIDSKTYTATHKFTLNKLGENIIYAYYSGYEKLNSSIKIIKTKIDLSVDNNSVPYGTEVTVTASITPGATGQITFKLNDETTGKTVNINQQTHTATTTYKLNTLGPNTIYAYYTGTKNYLNSNNLTKITVNPITPKIELTTNTTNIEYESEITVTAAISHNLIGKITFKLNDETTGKTVNINQQTHTATTTYKLNTLGPNTIYAYYTGTSPYTDSNSSMKITVKPITPNLKLSNLTVTVGEIATINVTINVNSGNIKFYIDDTLIGNVKITDTGSTSINYKTNIVKNSIITAEYINSSNIYYPTTSYSKLNIKPITVNNNTLNYEINANTIVFSMDSPYSDLSGNLEIKSNIRNFIINVKNGKAKETIQNLKAGHYEIYSMKFKSTNTNYSDSERNTFDSFDVPIDESMISIPKEAITYGNNANFHMNLPTGYTSNEVEFSVTIDNNKYSSEFIDGISNINVPKLSIGKHDVTMTVIIRDDIYTFKNSIEIVETPKSEPSANTNTVTEDTASKTTGTDKITIISKKITKVSKKAKKLVLKTKLKINKKLAKNKKVTFVINSKKYKANTNKKGVAKLTLKKSTLKKILKKVKVGKKIKYQIIYGKTKITRYLKVKK